MLRIQDFGMGNEGLYLELKFGNRFYSAPIADKSKASVLAGLKQIVAEMGG